MKRGIWWWAKVFKPKAHYEAMRPRQQRISFFYLQTLVKLAPAKRPQEALDGDLRNSVLQQKR